MKNLPEIKFKIQDKKHDKALNHLRGPLKRFGEYPLLILLPNGLEGLSLLFPNGLEGPLFPLKGLLGWFEEE